MTVLLLLLLLLLFDSVATQTSAGGCVRIGRSSSVTVDQLTMPSATFSFDTFFKFTEAPRLGDRVLALRSGSNFAVAITIDVNFENVPVFAVTAGAASGRTVSSTLPAPHEWFYLGIVFNATNRVLYTYLNDYTLANPITLAAAFQPTTLVLGDNAALLVDFARFAPGFSVYLANLYDWADFSDATVVHAPLLSFDSASGPVVVAPRGASSRTLADVSAGGDVSFVGLCAARQNFVVRVPSRSVAVNGAASECAWSETGLDTYALYRYAPNVVSQLRLLWDEDNLYLFVNVLDASPAPDTTGANDFRTDSIELYIAPSRQTNVVVTRYLIVQDAASNDAAFTTVARRAAQGMSWSIEVSMPWSRLGWSPSLSYPLLMLFATNDRVNSSFTGQVDNVGGRYQGSFVGATSVYSRVTLLPTVSSCSGTASPTTSLPPPPTTSLSPGPVATPTPTQPDSRSTSDGDSSSSSSNNSPPLTAGSNAVTGSFETQPPASASNGGATDGELPLELPYLIGIGIGACLLLLLLLALIVWCVACRRRRRRREYGDDYAPSAVMMHSAAPQGAYESPMQPKAKNLYDVADPEAPIKYETLAPDKVPEDTSNIARYTRSSSEPSYDVVH